MRRKNFFSNYPLSILCVLLIWFLCIFFKSPKTGLEQITFIDKIVHIIMYWGLCGLIWFEYLRSHACKSAVKLWAFAIIGPILMGGIIELVQGALTENRSCEWLDLGADIVGVLLGTLTGMYLLPKLLKRK